MMTLRKIVNKHPLTAFVIASYVLSWWSIPFAAGGLLPYGPFLAAILIVALTKGVVGLKEFFRHLLSWRARWHWLLIAPGLVIAYQGLAFILNIVLGAHTMPAPIESFPSSILGLLLLGGQWEEPGWTGYALPLLQERYANRRNGLALSSLHLGAIRAVWHIPLVISGAIPWYDVVFFIMAFQFLITWIFNKTGGSVLAVMLFHFTSNLGSLVVPFFSGFERARYRQLFVTLAWALALPLASLNGWNMGRSKNSS